ncbi:hypothetical protein SUGI_0127810 [Cryptomeria japonica]|uniref:protein ANTI-SILENCING 1 isoform X1 n=1 Tax=Cryptomeria japonica TaxID=3369 RepID=UPI002408B108|nr:protein ANTI-SILENCING 1 isoform X1 [Cryptomeria japonica]XP_057865053.2 protein ANTI-SILENCING 1 isoform X1 [Cryptomeria japonica]XP_057865054.2 protein ANTI-SILENCING 1 isoform X1 [Cryptomeria japonica]XP_057865055.2 protein ANTI-SILENCING 1 isoform X1 [Cryptomeria japonica]XP_057865057.2 protein ANTI-SILENCING 1 isoform X1 [Cryptomeria japonica]XP_057865058.2 protein ANTI-SILENCING 1 isoform X1 [Cryptomeria japonica]XP_057865059.2 protein ANTI-SILENCING 1 isoform X1 [Cryptomeria japonic
MAPPEEGPENTIIDEVANVEFRWGVKRGKGLKGKDIQFYDSFTYDGVEYSCYDCVYVHKEGEPEPYIGKIMKIWDDRKLKKKRIKVWWFFRPIEIRNFYEGDCSPANRELFLASGEGQGLFNVNLLEVIVGKCKVLCTSTDPRNPQPSEEDLNNADYFFNRTFDCGKRIVSESFEGLEAEAFLNKQAWVSKSVRSLDQQANGANENQANKSMANGSLFARKEGTELGISEGLTKSKVDTSTKEEEPKKDKASQKKLDDIEIKKEEMEVSMTVKGEGKGNETPKEEFKIIETIKEEMKGNGIPDEELRKGEITKEETKKNKTGKEEIEKNENSNDERKKSETATKGLTKAELEIPSKGIGKIDSPKQSPWLEVRSNDKKSSKNEPFKDEKEPLKRARAIVHSDDEADEMGGSANANRKKTDSKKEVSAPENRVVKKAKLSDNFNKTSEEVAKMTSHPKELIKEKKLGREIIEITKRPEVESNKWFKGLPWDERLKKGYEQRAVIRVQNFDPSYTSAEIDDIMWHMVGERCTARVMPQTMFSNPNSGDALVVFRTKEGAEMALKKLNQACLTFSDGRSLIATRATPVMSGKQKFAGHISIEKHKLLMQRAHKSEDMKKAVSTSHCSQPNTIEYEMAMEWRLLQEKSERWWNELFKQEASEVDDVKRKNIISKKKN